MARRSSRSSKFDLYFRKFPRTAFGAREFVEQALTGEVLRRIPIPDDDILCDFCGRPIAVDPVFVLSANPKDLEQQNPAGDAACNSCFDGFFWETRDSGGALYEVVKDDGEPDQAAQQ